VTEEQLLALGGYRESEAFGPVETLVLDLAVAMTSTPASVSDELRASLLEHFSQSQLAELAATIAWENHRARLNRALGVRAAGFSDGAVCAVPQLTTLADRP
jgi:alkylhydroperoxidase family enzyme